MQREFSAETDDDDSHLRTNKIEFQIGLTLYTILVFFPLLLVLVAGVYQFESNEPLRLYSNYKLTSSNERFFPTGGRFVLHALQVRRDFLL